MNTQTIEKEVHPIEEWDDFELAEGLDSWQNFFTSHYMKIMDDAKASKNQSLTDAIKKKWLGYGRERMAAMRMTTDERRKLLRRWMEELQAARKNPLAEFQQVVNHAY